MNASGGTAVFRQPLLYNGYNLFILYLPPEDRSHMKLTHFPINNQDPSKILQNILTKSSFKEICV